MNQYQNSYIGLKIDFPDNWHFSYWGNRNTVLANPEAHQENFEDLPSEKSPQKILVTSLSRFEKGPPLLKGSLQLVALFRPNGIDLAFEIPSNESEISRNHGNSVVAGKSTTFLHLEAQGEGYIRYTRYYYWQFRSNIWLGCVISGSSHEKFNEALIILENVESVNL